MYYEVKDLPPKTFAAVEKDYWYEFGTIYQWIDLLKRNELWTAEIEIEIMALMLSGGNE